VKNRLPLLALLALLSPAAALAQAAEAAKPGEPKPPPKWYETIEVHGYVDAYYQLRLDAAQDEANGLRAFDVANGFVLNLARVTVAMAPSPVGFRIDLGLGNTMNAISAVSGGNVAFLPVEQAYAAVKLGDVEIDVGRFATIVGAEVVEAKDNFHYSRSLLYTWAEPITHTGVKASWALPGGLTLQGFVANAWDLVTTNKPWKAFGLGMVYSGDSSTVVALNVIGGPNAGTIVNGAQYGGWQNLIDLVVQRAFGDVTVNLSGDYGVLGGQGKWYGVSGMAKYAPSGVPVTFALRGEWFGDPDGLRVGVTDGSYLEGTFTVGVPIAGNAEFRAEYRLDHANTSVFNGGTSANCSTVTGALLAWF
jgi:hypothetical protein